MKLKSPTTRNGKEAKIHVSDDNGLTTRCRKPVGRSWTVTKDDAAVTCSVCAGIPTGWMKMDKIRRRNIMGWKDEVPSGRTHADD